MNSSKKIFPKLSKKIQSFLTDESGKITKKQAFWVWIVWTLSSLESSQAGWWGYTYISNWGHLNTTSWWYHANAQPSTWCYPVYDYWVGYNGHYSNIAWPASYWWSLGHGSHGSHGSHYNDPSWSGTWSGDASCFLPSAQVLMFDRTYKSIWDLLVWDILMWIDAKPSTVIQTRRVILWNQRSMYYFPDNSLYFSWEHPFWIKNSQEEYWWVNDFNQYLRERNGWLDVNWEIFWILSKDAIPLVWWEYYAHLEKWWVQQSPRIDRSYGDQTQLIAIACSDSHTMIVNGYVVSAYADDRDFDYSLIKWNYERITKK